MSRKGAVIIGWWPISGTARIRHFLREVSTPNNEQPLWATTPQRDIPGEASIQARAAFPWFQKGPRSEGSAMRFPISVLPIHRDLMA